MWAEIVVLIVAAYLAVGLVVGVLFAFRGVSRLDPHAADAGVGFRLIIIPASCVLWPIVLSKWLGAKPAPSPNATEGDAA